MGNAHGGLGGDPFLEGGIPDPHPSASGAPNPPSSSSMTRPTPSSVHGALRARELGLGRPISSLRGLQRRAPAFFEALDKEHHELATMLLALETALDTGDPTVRESGSSSSASLSLSLSLGAAASPGFLGCGGGNLPWGKRAAIGKGAGGLAAALPNRVRETA